VLVRDRLNSGNDSKDAQSEHCKANKDESDNIIGGWIEHLTGASVTFTITHFASPLVQLESLRHNLRQMCPYWAFLGVLSRFRAEIGLV